MLVCFFVYFLFLFDYLFGWLNVRLCLLVGLCFIVGSFVHPFHSLVPFVRFRHVVYLLDSFACLRLCCF